MGKLFYYVMPSLNVNPESEGAPKLGSIFPNRKKMFAPLNQDEHVAIPEKLKNQHARESSVHEIGANFSITAGIKASLAYVFGSTDVLYTEEKNKGKKYVSEHFENFEFEPTAEYVKQAMASPSVQKHIDRGRVGKKKVLMVTGIQIATGLTEETTRSSTHIPQLHLQFPLAALTAVPVDVGPTLDVKGGKTTRMELGRALNKTVFAYRLICITPKSDQEYSFKQMAGGKFSLEDSDEEVEDEWHLQPLLDDDKEADLSEHVRVEIVQGMD